jgi:hypothetical protein
MSKRLSESWETWDDWFSQQLKRDFGGTVHSEQPLAQDWRTRKNANEHCPQLGPTALRWVQLARANGKFAVSARQRERRAMQEVGNSNYTVLSLQFLP